MKFNIKVNCPYSINLIPLWKKRDWLYLFRKLFFQFCIKLENLYAMKYFLNYGHSNELKILDLQTFYINFRPAKKIFPSGLSQSNL